MASSRRISKHTRETDGMSEDCNGYVSLPSTSSSSGSPSLYSPSNFEADIMPPYISNKKEGPNKNCATNIFNTRNIVHGLGLGCEPCNKAQEQCVACEASTRCARCAAQGLSTKHCLILSKQAEAPASTPKRRRVDTPSSLYTTDSAARHHEWQSFGSQRSPTKRVKRSSRGKNPEPSARKVAREATRVLNSFENTDEDHGGTYNGTKIAEAITKAIARNKNRGKDSISARTLAKILQSVASRAPSYEATEEASPQPDPMDEVLPQAEPIEEADEVVNRSVHSNRDSLEALNKSFQTAGKKVTALNGSMHLLWDSVESMNREFRANAESLAALNMIEELYEERGKKR